MIKNKILQILDAGFLPDVTAADNGKALVVVNGVWDKEEIITSISVSDDGKGNVSVSFGG